MSLTVKSMATLFVVMMIVAAILGQLVNITTGVVVALAVMVAEGAGYGLCIILPLWRYKYTGKATLPVSNWRWRALEFWYGEVLTLPKGSNWKAEIITTPKYSSLCYLGTCIWMAAHAYVFCGLCRLIFVRGIYGLCYLIFVRGIYGLLLKPVGHLFRWIGISLYRSVLTPLGHLLTGLVSWFIKPLLPTLPRWVALFCLVMLACYINPDSRGLLASIVVWVTAGIVALTALIWIGYGVKSLWGSIDWDRYLDPTAPQDSQFALWFAISWLLLLVLSPLAWWYSETIAVLFGILSVVFFLITLATAIIAFASLFAAELKESRWFWWIGYILLYAGWSVYWWCYVVPRNNQSDTIGFLSIITLLMGVLPPLALLIVLLVRGIRELAVRITDYLRKHRVSPITPVPALPRLPVEHLPKKRAKLAVAVEVKPQPRPSFFKQVWASCRLKFNQLGVKVSNQIADWAETSHKNLEDLEGRFCPIALPYFQGEEPAVVIVINSAEKLYGYSRFVGKSVNELISTNHSLWDYYRVDIPNLYAVVNHREVSPDYMIENGDIIQIMRREAPFAPVPDATPA